MNRQLVNGNAGQRIAFGLAMMLIVGLMWGIMLAPIARAAPPLAEQITDAQMVVLPYAGHLPPDAFISAMAVTTLTVTKNDSPDPAEANKPLTYTISVINPGPGTAFSISLIDTLGWQTNAVTFKSVTSTLGGPCVSSVVANVWVIGCPNIDLSPSQMATMTVVVTPTAAGVLPNTATVNPSDTTNFAGTSDTEFTQIIGQTDLLVSKSDSSDPVVVGLPFTYTLVVTNVGPNGDYATTTLTDTLPTGVTPGPEPPGCVYSAPTLTCTLSSLDVFSSTTINWVVTPTVVGVITNTAGVTVTGGATDPNPTNNFDTETTTVIGPVDLLITKTVKSIAPSLGKVTTFTIAYQNLGPLTATGVVITDFLASNVNYVTDTLGIAPITTPTTIRWNLPGTLGPGESDSFDLGVNLTPTSCSGSISFTNTAQIAAAQTESDPANNIRIVTAGPISCLSDLVVVKNDGIGTGNSRLQAMGGEYITYTISVNNVGGGTATGVVLTETLPANTIFVGPSIWTPIGGNQYIYPVPGGSLAPGNGRILTFVVQVAPTLTCGITQTVNMVQAGSNNGDAALADNTSFEQTSLICDPTKQLQVSKNDGVSCAAPNQIITYTITYSNNGTLPANNAFLSDLKSQYTNFLPGGPNTGWVDQGSGVYSRTLGTVPTGGPQGPLYFQVQLVGPNTIPSNVTAITNVITINGTNPFTEVTLVPLQPDLVVAKNDNIGLTGMSAEFAALYEQVTGQPPVAPDVSAQQSAVGPGDIIDYTIVYVNNGRAPATNVVLTETLPLYTTYAGGPEWTNVSGSLYRYNAGTLNPGQGGYVNFRVQVAGTLPPTLTYIINRADVGGDGSAAECNLSNSVSYEQTPVTPIIVTTTLYLPIIMKNAAPPTSPSAGMNWSGQNQDKVRDVDGSDSQSFAPDGRNDGAFLVNLNVGSGPKTIAHMSLVSSQGGGSSWDTLAGNGVWVLGVFDGGARLNGANGTLNQIVNGSATVTIYGSDTNPNSRFPPDTYNYTVNIAFTDGSSVSAVARIPKVVTPPPILLANVSDVKADPDTNQVFVASPRQDGVYVINGSSDTLARNVPVGNGPTGLTVLKGNSSASNKVFVAHQYGANDWHPGFMAFGVNDTSAHNTMDTGYAGAAPIKTAANSLNNRRVYVSNYYDKLAVYEGDSGPPENRLGWVVQKGFQGAYGIDTSAATNRVYLATRDTGELVVFDGNGDRLLQSDYIPTHLKPPQPCSLWSVGVNETTGHVFVPCPQLGRVFVLQESQFSLLDLEALGVLEVREGGLALVVSPQVAPWLVELNIPNGVGLGEEGIAVDTTTGRVFITNARTNSLVILQDGPIPVYVTTIPVGTTPQGVDVNPATQKVYVGNTGSNSVTVLNAASPFAVIKTISF